MFIEHFFLGSVGIRTEVDPLRYWLQSKPDMATNVAPVEVHTLESAMIGKTKGECMIDGMSK